MQRRSFIKNTALAAMAAGIAGSDSLAAGQQANKLPQWKGFNLTDFNTPDPSKPRHDTPEAYFQWMQDWGFNFVRLPVAYPYYLRYDRSKNITPDEVYQTDEQQINKIETLVHLAHKYNMHVSLNLHRAPGYCINAGFEEPYHLWTDQAALDAFCFHWGMWAKRFKNTGTAKLSFDLVNEPSMRKDMNDQHSPGGPVPGDLYYKVAKAAVAAIHHENSERIIIADGNNGGSLVIPELASLPVAQSCRGYNPHAISHYKAPWASSDPEHMPVPAWPGMAGNKPMNREVLEAFYQPWIELMKSGTGVHCGECGAWKKTPHAVFLAWFNDVLDILSSNKIGFALWEFSGDFGILDSGRTDVAYENWQGHLLDRKLLSLLQKY
ncbi:glycoside hydrolase family 5 protein [Deminuibacter soli]|uniref:Glycosyl hydrolase family 5 n=1 Tax=Deminuibacter soli TaxID=2291815 RepID=A0A3E1NJ10_9BACT|nr:cellulase family glycosylhydrolase [Deminuibacter soli]RFM27768.1 glycosyl hydrolase family 5 [Deminuibacter soli]